MITKERTKESSFISQGMIQVQGAYQIRAFENQPHLDNCQWRISFENLVFHSACTFTDTVSVTESMVSYSKAILEIGDFHQSLIMTSYMT